LLAWGRTLRLLLRLAARVLFAILGAGSGTHIPRRAAQSTTFETPLARPSRRTGLKPTGSWQARYRLQPALLCSQTPQRSRSWSFAKLDLPATITPANYQTFLYGECM
jgi:hypothetical protein